MVTLFFFLNNRIDTKTYSPFIHFSSNAFDDTFCIRYLDYKASFFINVNCLLFHGNQLWI